MTERTSIPRVVVAGLGAGCGKTTVALGLVGALRRRGRTTQAFKVGPELVDSVYLAHASGRPCRNLDSWMLGRDGAVASFVHGVRDADCAVIDGARGLFDSHGAGEGEASFAGSTAQLAHLLGAPVILVIDVSGTAETAAAVALGVCRVDPSLDVIGVVLDNVPSDHRRRVVEDAVWEHATVPVLGAIPSLENLNVPEVRAGVRPLAQSPEVDAALDELTAAVERHCDVALIERVMARVGSVQTESPVQPAPARRAPRVSIAVAFDDAFCFYYAENLELLEDAGAELVTFSPLEDRALPHADAVYLGGGLSEELLPRLARNRPMLDALRRAHDHAVPIYAESGGLLYCARSVRTSDGESHPMAGLAPLDVELSAGRPRAGYRSLRVAADGLLADAGVELRGHEFHFARVTAGARNANHAYSMHDVDGEPLGCDGWSSPLLLASLVHLHFGQDRRLADRLVEAARQRAARRQDALAAV